jgi:hypothetical protein
MHARHDAARGRRRVIAMYAARGRPRVIAMYVRLHRSSLALAWIEIKYMSQSVPQNNSSLLNFFIRLNHNGL